jgi:hypothetical protein
MESASKRAWLICAMAFVSTASFAVFPTLVCSDAEKSIRFSEQDDHFRLDYQGKNSERTLLAHLVELADDQHKELELRFAKKLNDATETPACSFAADAPTVWSCIAIREAQGLIITDKATRLSSSIRITNLTLETQITHEQSFGNEDTDKAASTFQFRFVAVVGKPGLNIHTFHETSFALSDCSIEGAHGAP